MISVWSCSQCPVYFCLWHMTWTIGQNSSKFSFREWGSYLGLRIVWELTAIIMAIAATPSVISHHQSVECQQPLLLWQLLQCHFYPLLPSTLHFVSSKTVQYWSHKNKIYMKSMILHELSQELPYSVGSFQIWNTCYTVLTLQQLQLSPCRFQVSVLKFSNVHSIHKHTAFLRYRLRCFKHNSSSSTPRPVNHHRVIKSSSVPACNSVFWKLFEEAVKSIGVVSWSSRAVFIRYKFFLKLVLLWL